MKTTDLIPVILYQLTDGDRYGYEIIKQIEDSSNGKLIIKQPTLYSVLKKLEQGRFISSYWQDSEIGGKRHYYKLTDNGKAQLSTYPAYDSLLKDILEDENVSPIENLSPKQEISDKNLNNPINDDEIPNVKEQNISLSEYSNLTQTENATIVPTPIDITKNISSSENTFDFNKPVEPIIIEPVTKSSNCEEQSVKDKTPKSNQDIKISIEQENDYDTKPASPTLSIFEAIEYNEEPQIISNNKTLVNDNIVNEDLTPKFTEKVDNITSKHQVDKFSDKIEPTNLIENKEKVEETDVSYISTQEEVRYLNYVDFNADKTTIKRRKAINQHILKMIFTTSTLLLMFVISLILCSKYSYSRLYYIFAIVGGAIIVLYPLLLIKNISKLRLKYCSAQFKYSISIDLFVKLSIFLSLIIIIFAYNLTIVNNISDIFTTSNFANFLCPILFAVVVMLDFVYNVICYRQYFSKQ